MSNPKQTKAALARYKKFAQNYVIDHNGTRSAKAAGYSVKTAVVTASKMLRIPKVQALICQYETELADRTNNSQDKIITELGRMAYANLQDFMIPSEDGSELLVDFSNVTRDQMAGLQEFTIDTTGGEGDGERKVVLRTKIKLADKTRNLELIARILGYITEKKEVKTTAEKMTDDEINKRLVELGVIVPEQASEPPATD